MHNVTHMDLPNKRSLLHFTMVTEMMDGIIEVQNICACTSVLYVYVHACVQVYTHINAYNAKDWCGKKNLW